MEKRRTMVLRSFLDTGRLPPISFIYGGRPSCDFLSDWKVARSAKDEEDIKFYTVKYADPVSSLELVSEIINYKNFPAVEWVLHFKNVGSDDTPVLEDIQALDFTMDITPGKDDPPLQSLDVLEDIECVINPNQHGEVILHRSLGSTSTVSDFAPVDEILPPGCNRRVIPIGGRSSDRHMPFFNLEIPGNREVIVAIGWTGQWAAYFKRSYLPDDNKVTIRVGMEHTHLKLYPGEEIRVPQILLFFWDGDRIASHNQFRRFVLRHKTPQIEGKAAELPIAATSWFQYHYGNGVTEKNQIVFAQTYQKMGLDIECYWVDAGWFEGGWPDGVGNWFSKKEAFPNGLKKLSEAVHKMGMKFLLWFEPERVAKDSWLQCEHPEWLLDSSEENAKFFCPDPKGPQNYLLNMGNPEARAWLTDHVSQIIKANSIDIYRHDCNIDPLVFWRLSDAPDRQGLTEIRYVEGLYSYWEELKRRHPGLLIENCCSGNRRFDLETISRCINLWRSDYVFRPVGDQCQTYGLSFYAVLHSNGCGAVDKYGFRSALGPGMCLCWDPRNPKFPLEQARKNIALSKRVRPYFRGDYYPLTPYSTKENVWMAYQFHCPDLGEGVVLAFRRPSCPRSEVVLELGGLLQNAEYELENVDTGKKELHKAAELSSGLRVVVESRPGSVVLIYRRIKLV